MLKEMPKNTGAAGGGKKDGPRGNYLEQRHETPTHSDLSLDKKTSSIAQKLAALLAFARQIYHLGRGERHFLLGEDDHLMCAALDISSDVLAFLFSNSSICFFSDSF